MKIGYSDCKETLNDRMKQYISKIAETKVLKVGFTLSKIRRKQNCRKLYVIILQFIFACREMMKILMAALKRESNSISSQRELARSFVREQPDMELFDIYIDDGCSGANFDRPDFKRMMADIEDGNVNCVVVKDLSRFGRDYIEAGRFIQKTFPAFSVRFIAITDHYDSLTADKNTTSFVIPVKNFVNDFYCQDISEKVKSHQRLKREKGKIYRSLCSLWISKRP